MRTSLLLFSASLCGAAALARPAFADHVTVTTTADVVADDGQCSLREAIDVYNLERDTADCPLVGDAGPSSIQLGAGTYTLAGAPGEDANASGDLDVITSLVIAGAGSDRTIISGADTERVFDAAVPRLELRGLSLVHGAGDGAIVRAPGATLVLDHVWVRDTTGGTSILAAGVLVASDSTVLDTQATGATIDARDTRVTRATLAGNVAATLLLATDLLVENATITGNTTTRLLYSTGARSQCEFSTIVDNTGALAERSMFFHHVIVANDGPCTAALGSGGGNVLADTAATSCIRMQPSDVVGLSPRLAPLRMNGGATPTRKPSASSPARDLTPCPIYTVVDQRGVARPQFGLCDTGAVELAPVLVRAVAEPAGPRCALGGVALVQGEDRDGNGLVAASEPVAVTYACSTSAMLLTVSAEPAGAHCARGGDRISAGVDADADGALAPAETTSTAYLCAATGALAVTSVEPAGDRCAAGGTRVDAGGDDDGDGALAAAEVRSTAVACRGALAGDAASPEPPGEHCAEGGTRIDHGIDADGDGVLAPGEIASTTYVCAATDALVTVTREPAGEHCAAGGERVDTGHDVDADGVLAPGEIEATTYACGEAAAGCSALGAGAPGGAWGGVLVVAAVIAGRRRRTARRAAAPMLGASLGVTLALAAPARADSVTVTTTADEVAADGACSLREAIRVLDRGQPDPDCVPVADPESVVALPAGTFTLTGAAGDDANASGDLDITHTLTLRGAGADLTILGAAGTDRVIDTTGPALSLEGLTLRDGAGDGAAIRGPLARVRLDHVAVLQSTGGTTVVVAANVWIQTSLVLNTQATTATISAPSINVLDSTLAGNFAPTLLLVTDVLQLERDTVTGNVTTQLFGDSTARAQLRFVTVADNAGALRGTFQSFFVEYSIIAGTGWCAAAPSSAAYSLLSDEAAESCVRPTGGPNLELLPANLAPLDYYGGPIPTRRPLPASPARDAVPCPAFAIADQRGVTRPQFGWCDVGAVEVAPFTMRAIVEPAGARCPRGGVALERGEDRDGNGTLDAAEVATSAVACSTAATLVSLSPGAAGAPCARGGDRIDAGADQDGDHALQPAEVTSSAYLCRDAGALAQVTEMWATARCPLGGIQIATGGDVDEDGTLAQAEVRSTAYVCRAGVGLDVASDEPAGERCPAGGTRIDHGVDLDGDGALAAAEITSVTYACDATDELASVSAEPAGAHCPEGGRRVDTGRDRDGDGALGLAEITDTAYACDEASGGCAASGGAGAGAALALLGVLGLARRPRRR